MTDKAEESEAKEDVERVEKLEGIGNQSILHDKQAPEETSSLTEPKVIGSIASEIRNDDLNNKVQDEINNGEKKTGKFGHNIMLHLHVHNYDLVNHRTRNAYFCRKESRERGDCENNS